MAKQFCPTQPESYPLLFLMKREPHQRIRPYHGTHYLVITRSTLAVAVALASHEVKKAQYSWNIFLLTHIKPSLYTITTCLDCKLTLLRAKASSRLV